MANLNISGFGFSQPHDASENVRIKILLKSNNKILNRKARDMIVLNIFAKCRHVTGSEEIVVTGQVLEDGKGDWFAMLNMCHHLQKNFPDRVVRLIVSSSKNHEGQLKAPKVKAVNLIYSEEEQDFDRETLQKVKDAGVVIIGPVSSKEAYREIEKDISEKSIALNEYDGGSNSNEFALRKEFMGLGLKSLGIFTKSLKKDYQWQDLQNGRLKEILFKTIDPSQVEVDGYFSDHCCFLGYMGSALELVKFMRDAILLNDNYQKKTLCDFFCPLKSHISELEQHLNELNAVGVGVVKLVYFENDQKIERDVNISQSGKMIRIIDVGLLEARDFKILTNLSGPLVGCTGDNSIAQVLSFGKIPYYEIRGHKNTFYDALKSAQRENYDNGRGLSKYFWDKKHGNDTSQHLKDPHLLIEQAKIFGDYVQKNLSFNSNLVGLVNERLYYQKFPESALKVNKIREDFLASKLSIQEFEEQIHKIIASDI